MAFRGGSDDSGEGYFTVQYVAVEVIGHLHVTRFCEDKKRWVLTSRGRSRLIRMGMTALSHPRKS